jgi:hypothetical protein
MARVINGAAAAVSATIDTTFGRVTFEFAHGKKLVVDVNQLSEANRLMAACHGIKQKIGDAAAISRVELTGRSASIEDKYANCLEVFERITSADGTWNKVRGDGTGSTGVGGLLYRALVRLYDGRQTPEQVRKYLDGLDAEQQALLRTKNTRVRDTIAAIKIEDAARRAETNEDDGTDAMLADGLGPIPE